MTEPETSRTGEHRLIAYRVTQLEGAVSEIRDAVRSIDKSLQLISLVEGQYAAARLV